MFKSELSHRQELRRLGAVRGLAYYADINEYTQLYGPDDGPNLDGTHYNKCSMRDSHMENCTGGGGGTMSDCDMSGASLTGSTFAGAVLSGSTYSSATWTGCTFTNSTLSALGFIGCQWNNTAFKNCTWSQLNFDTCDWQRVGILDCHCDRIQGKRITGEKVDFKASESFYENVELEDTSINANTE